MYSTCIFCHSALGTNESVEHFPIGRRLAFDAARGRLWAVCRRCERWNLTPVEERWEAIEECERLFTATKLRASTDQVGLTRLRDGLELVRIGRPQLPEMAGWRYGDQFGRRRRRHLTYVGVGIVAAGALTLGQLTGAFVAGGAIVNFLPMARRMYDARRARVRLPLRGRPNPVTIRTADLVNAAIEPDGDGWALHISHHERPAPASIFSPARRSFRIVDPNSVYERLTGDEAVRAIGQILPAINEKGASGLQVRSAIDLIERTPERDALMRRWIAPHPAGTAPAADDPPNGRRLSALPREALLALEIATHDETERRALEGELSILEEMWREAEEVAAIADALLVPDEATRRLASLSAPANPPGSRGDGG